MGGLDKAGEINRSQTSWDLVDHTKGFDLYPKNNGELLKGSGRGGVTYQTRKDHLVCGGEHGLGMGPSGYADASQMTVATAQLQPLLIIQTELEITQ